MSTGRLVIKILDLLVDETDCPKEAADILVLALTNLWLKTDMPAHTDKRMADEVKEAIIYILSEGRKDEAHGHC